MSEMMLTEKQGVVGTPDEQRMEMAILVSAVGDRLFLVRAMDEGFDVSLFRSPPARLIASLLTDMRDEVLQATDLLVLRSKLEERGQLAPQVLQYLDALSRTLPPPPERVLSYLDFLRERAGRELMGGLAKDMEEFSHSRDGNRASVFDFSERCIQRLMKLQQSRAKKRLVPLNESVREVMTTPKIDSKQVKALLGYSLAPFVRLEHALAGLRRGFYYGLAGAPRRGKTNFALHLASQLASNHGIPVLFDSWSKPDGY